jgi:hypothetical protein
LAIPASEVLTWRSGPLPPAVRDAIRHEARRLGLRQIDVARIINLNAQLSVGRQVFFCQLGGFDTHANQLAANASDYGALGSALAAFDADLVLFDPDAVMTVNSAALQQRHKLTPYDGYVLRGRVRATYLRGVKVWDDGRLVHAGRGGLL